MPTPLHSGQRLSFQPKSPLGTRPQPPQRGHQTIFGANTTPCGGGGGTATAVEVPSIATPAINPIRQILLNFMKISFV